MHDNRNKEVIKRVEKGMMKANRTRNIFAIVAVAPTTFMITTVFSLGINYKENMELTSVRTSGTNANVSLAGFLRRVPRQGTKQLYQTSL